MFHLLPDIIFELKMNKKQLERMAKKAEKEEKKEQANVRKVNSGDQFLRTKTRGGKIASVRPSLSLTADIWPH